MRELKAEKRRFRVIKCLILNCALVVFTHANRRVQLKAVSCTHLFACVKRANAQTSIKHDFTRKRLIPAFSSLIACVKRANAQTSIKLDFTRKSLIPAFGSLIACVKRANAQTSIKHDFTRKRLIPAFNLELDQTWNHD
jgi:hypothetical protein